MWMRRFLALCALGVVGLAPACGHEASAGTQSASDRAAVRGLESRFHQAMTSKDLNQMMSLWTNAAVLTAGGKSHRGIEEIRSYFAETAPVFKLQNNWIVLTAGWRIDAAVKGDNGTLYFECYFIDRLTKTVKAASGAHATVVRRSGRWLISSLVSRPITLGS